MKNLEFKIQNMFMWRIFILTIRYLERWLIYCLIFQIKLIKSFITLVIRLESPLRLKGIIWGSKGKT